MMNYNYINFFGDRDKEIEMLGNINMLKDAKENLEKIACTLGEHEAMSIIDDVCDDLKEVIFSLEYEWENMPDVLFMPRQEGDYVQ